MSDFTFVNLPKELEQKLFAKLGIEANALEFVSDDELKGELSLRELAVCRAFRFARFNLRFQASPIQLERREVPSDSESAGSEEESVQDAEIFCFSSSEEESTPKRPLCRRILPESGLGKMPTQGQTNGDRQRTRLPSNLPGFSVDEDMTGGNPRQFIEVLETILMGEEIHVSRWSLALKRALIVGNAAQWAMSNLKADLPWSMAKATFIETFSDYHQMEKDLNELALITQTSTVTVYATNFIKLMKYTGRAMDDPMLLSQFRRNLSDEIRPHYATRMAVTPPSTIFEAAEMAKDTEMSLAQVLAPARQGTGAAGFACNRKRLSPSTPRTESPKMPRPQAQGTCAVHTRSSHRDEDCFRHKSSPAREKERQDAQPARPVPSSVVQPARPGHPLATQQARTPTFTAIECHRCGKPGHKARECRAAAPQVNSLQPRKD